MRYLSLLVLLACDGGSFGTDDSGTDEDAEHDEVDGGQEGEANHGEDSGEAVASSHDGVFLTADSPSTNLGEIFVGCEADVVVEVTNEGNAPVTLNFAEFVGGEGRFSIIAIPEPALRIASLETVPLPLRFTPLRAGALTTTLRLAENGDSPTLFEHELLGTGLVFDEIDDTFTADGAADRFTLSRAAVGETLQVEQDGAPIDGSLWSFVATTNQVIFTTPPPADATISAKYVVDPVGCR
ncbi:MAG: hypothetical protein AAFV53_05545 [Myxococcota bacterium]